MKRCAISPLVTLAAINGQFTDVAPDDVTLMEFWPGVSYRNCFVCRNAPPGTFTRETKTQPPHDIPDRPIADYLPTGPGSELLRDVMEQSRKILGSHPINQARRAAGKRPATQVWLWGQGQAPSLQPFRKVYGQRGHHQRG
jgi:2,3-bisphosphoglycerate-independent phosphoglycerate mutase